MSEPVPVVTAASPSPSWKSQPLLKGNPVNKNENRLSDEDVTRIRQAMTETFERWDPRGPRNDANELATLERVGRHAIGCGEADLRDVELEAIADMARAVLGLPALELMTPDKFDQLERVTRDAVVALITRNGRDNNLACLSPYGATTRDCAEVVADLVALHVDYNAVKPDSFLIESIMSQVVNAYPGLLDEDLAQVAEMRAEGVLWS